jgi:phage shock protein PspC (stress-responsive transcriptional regulator)
MNTNAQMYANSMYETFQRPRRVICGVCARLSENSGVPAWIIRVVAVCLLLAHAGITFVLYFGAAIWMRSHRSASYVGPIRNAPPPSWDRNGLVNRFDGLDSRLSRMEREAMDREAALRRAFHDLDRG